ncbi:hypothetical protein [Acinetobacter pittii]|uniref:hypothetical protein n=1 Tax=Acinetobacter pittii TaxID=48296 RepID=UPI0021CD1FA2|nr:hypothetical protein [Acinetobacter pittii]
MAWGLFYSAVKIAYKVYYVDFREINKLIMSNDTKFCLGLKLNVGLITSKEIQIWADKKILEDKNDPFVLDICFLESETEVKDYFNNLTRADLDIHNKRLISINVLKEYISKKKPSNLDSDLDQYINDIELICWHIHDSALTSLLHIYGDQINLAYQGVLTISVQKAFDEFSEHVNEWLEKSS